MAFRRQVSLWGQRSRIEDPIDEAQPSAPCKNQMEASRRTKREPMVDDTSGRRNDPRKQPLTGVLQRYVSESYLSAGMY